jgi:hypothetical protein
MNMHANPFLKTPLPTSSDLQGGEQYTLCFAISLSLHPGIQCPMNMEIDLIATR